MNTKGSTFTLILKGAAMGIAETIPGVSGGTIAFITGIYERLLNSINSFATAALPAWKEGGLAALWKAIDGNFLLFLVGGMLVGILGGVFGMSYLLDHHPLQVWGFFFGLILASVVYVAKQVQMWNVDAVVALLVAMLLAYWVTIASPAEGSDSYLYVFMCGLIAISALMLPGLSGSFMLLLLGMYQFILHDTLKEGILEQHDPSALITLGVFGLGCLIGVFTFAKLLSYLFARFRNTTLAVLTGFMFGSLNKVWPWQEVVATRVDSKGEEKVLFSNSVSPADFSQLTDNFFYGNDPQLFSVVAIMVLGFVSIFAIERMGRS